MLKHIVFFLFLLCGILFPQTDPNTKSEDLEEEEFLLYEGKYVRKIIFRPIDVAGPSVEENNGEDTSWFANITNALHYTTRDWVIRNYLLFKEGEQIEAIDISESERLLRESAFFLDARIKLIPVENTDSVDVRVTTKDRWTLILQLSFNAQKNSYAGIKDDNLLGLGHRLDGTVTHDNDPIIGWGSKLMYTAHNIAGSFTDITAGIEANKKTSLKVLDINRPFVSLRTKVAGGLNLQWNSSKLLYVNRDSSSLLPFSNFFIDLWGGYSFPVIFGPSVFRKKTNITAAVGIKRSQYVNRPYVSMDSNRVFANNIMYLFNTGIINKRYYRDHYIQRFGPTEDVPVGGLLSLTGGYDINEFTKRYYSGVEALYSRRISGIGYLSLYTAAGGYYRNKTWEQNAYNMELLFHSRLFEQNSWRWRFFLQNSYLIGTNRYEQEQIFLDSENGLRGHDRFSLHGIRRGLLKLETRIFTPLSILGFNFGVNTFMDFGIIADEGEKLFNSKLYQSYGSGLRIANESISKAQFDVNLVFMPFTAAKSGGVFTVLFSSSFIVGSRQFNISKPSVIDYGEN